MSVKEPDWGRRMGLDCYPVAILQDRYGGTYLGGDWLALAKDSASRREAVEGMYGDDCEAANFVVPEWAAVGNTPNEALANLYRKIGLAKFPEYATPDLKETP